MPCHAKILGIQLSLVAEATADIRRDDPDSLFVHREVLGDADTKQVRNLRRTDHDQLFQSGSPSKQTDLPSSGTMHWSKARPYGELGLQPSQQARRSRDSLEARGTHCPSTRMHELTGGRKSGVHIVEDRQLLIRNLHVLEHVFGHRARRSDRPSPRPRRHAAPCPLRAAEGPNTGT